MSDTRSPSRQPSLEAPAEALGPSRGGAGKCSELAAGVLLPSAVGGKVAVAKNGGASCVAALLLLAPAGAERPQKAGACVHCQPGEGVLLPSAAHVLTDVDIASTPVAQALARSRS